MNFFEDLDNIKKGNGAEYMYNLEKEKHERHMKRTHAIINTRDNIFYKQIRDKLAKTQTHAK